jgi:hypothetical protein
MIPQEMENPTSNHFIEEDTNHNHNGSSSLTCYVVNEYIIHILETFYQLSYDEPTTSLYNCYKFPQQRAGYQLVIDTLETYQVSPSLTLSRPRVGK